MDYDDDDSIMASRVPELRKIKTIVLCGCNKNCHHRLVWDGDESGSGLHSIGIPYGYLCKTDRFFLVG